MEKTKTRLEINAYANGAGSYLVQPVNFEKFTKLMDTFSFYGLAWNKIPGLNDGRMPDG